MASDVDFVPDKRLHPLSWLFVLWQSIKQLIVPIVAAIIFGARNHSASFGLALLVPLLIAALWRQRRFRYGFGPHALVVKEGLLFQNLRQIEYDRIENVDTQRGVLHRLMNVAEVRLESSRGGRPEATIRVLSLDAVQELRDRIFGGQSEAASDSSVAAQQAEQMLLKLPLAELIRYGLVDNRGMIVVAAAFGAAGQTGLLENLGRIVGQRIFAESTAAFGTAVFAVALVLLIAIVLAVRALSVAWALVTLHGFTLAQRGTDLLIRYGLLTRVGLTLRLPRIQAVHETETFLHRFFGRVSLAVDLAGGGLPHGNEGDMSRTRVRWLAPICPPQVSEALTRVALPMLSGDSQPDWQPLAPGARSRIFRKTTFIATLICAVPAVLWLKLAAPLLWLAIVPLSWLHATQYVRHTRWALTREALVFRRGWLTRRVSYVPRVRIQVAHQSESPFDRRTNMASVVVDTAGANVLAGPICIRYLSKETAVGLCAALYGSAGERVLNPSDPPLEVAVQLG
ncbi:MAG TPA: PH domain-containing protein [Steroidobacteraceae bacterium]